MSKFHEIIKELLEEVQAFLTSTLAAESLTANAISKKESILMKLSVICEEYPQLQRNSQTKDSLKNINMPVITTKLPHTGSVTSIPASPPPYFDMQPGKSNSPTLAQKTLNVIQASSINSEDYEEYEGDPNNTFNSNIIPKNEPKSLLELDSIVLDESLKEIPDIPAAELKKSLKNGFLEKKGKERLGGLLSPFQKRWCAVTNGIMYIFESEYDKKQKSHIHLYGYEARVSPMSCKDVNKKNLCFELVCPGKRSYQFIALTAKDLKQWMAAVDGNNTILETNIASTQLIQPLKLNESPYKKEIKLTSSLVDKKKDVPNSASSVIGNQVLIESDSDDIYEPVDELESPAHNEPLYEEGEMLSDEELYVDGGEHPPPNTRREIEDPTNEPDFNPGDWYVALWDCDTSDPLELKFTRGDLIKIIGRQFDAHEWWTGSLNKKTGLVPKIYLMEAYEQVLN